MLAEDDDELELDDDELEELEASLEQSRLRAPATDGRQLRGPKGGAAGCAWRRSVAPGLARLGYWLGEARFRILFGQCLRTANMFCAIWSWTTGGMRGL